MHETYKILIGCPGTGNTHLATAIAIRAIQLHHCRAKFLSIIDLFKAVEQETEGE